MAILYQPRPMIVHSWAFECLKTIWLRRKIRNGGRNSKGCPQRTSFLV